MFEKSWPYAALGLLLLGSGALATSASAQNLESEKAVAANIIGPEGTDNSCVNCHANETEAWKKTRHFRTFKDRHRSKRAKEILKNLNIRSMKRSNLCRHCHYTSVLAKNRIRAKWGVACESCHGPGRAWNNVHNKVEGDEKGKALKWGEGKKESVEQRATRLGAAVAKGMIHSKMLYQIARNCFRCHTVPSEPLVNKGKHNAGSDFDLVVWSQGEVRHNFLSSAGAPDQPTNRPATAEEKRTRYLVGALVDLEVSLRNLLSVKDKRGDFHMAMIERVNRARKKVDAVLKVVKIGDLIAVVNVVPQKADPDTSIKPDFLQKLSEATKRFVEKGAKLDAIDGQIPTEVKGNVFQ